MTGRELIEEERKRQIEVEGWTLIGDDDHELEQLRHAGKAYEKEARFQAERGMVSAFLPTCWPWHRDWWKPVGGPVRLLEKAGALYLAEAERCDRRGDSLRAMWNRGRAARCARVIDELQGTEEDGK